MVSPISAAVQDKVESSQIELSNKYQNSNTISLNKERKGGERKIMNESQTIRTEINQPANIAKVKAKAILSIIESSLQDHK